MKCDKTLSRLDRLLPWTQGPTRVVGDLYSWLYVTTMMYNGIIYLCWLSIYVFWLSVWCVTQKNCFSTVITWDRALYCRQVVIWVPWLWHLCLDLCRVLLSWNCIQDDIQTYPNLGVCSVYPLWLLTLCGNWCNFYQHEILLSIARL